MAGSALLREAGPAAQERAPLAAAIEALLSLGLPEAETATFLEQLFVRTRLDDIETLSRLRLLVEVDPDAGQRRQRPPEQEIEQLRELLRRAYATPKRPFQPRMQSARTAKLIARVQKGLR